MAPLNFLTKPMRLLSDGTAKGTQLLAVDGTEIDLSRCQEITWTVSGKRRFATVTVTFFAVAVDAAPGLPPDPDPDREEF